MKPEPLIAEFAKIEWTKTEIENLNTEIKAFFESCPYEIISEVNAKGTEEVWRFRIPKPLPGGLSVRAGAIINNIRAPLDQVICAIGKQATGSELNFAFPFGNTRDEFERGIRKQVQRFGLPPDAAAIVRKAKPYRRGNHHLWALNHLDSRNKHRPKLIPINLRTTSRNSWLSIRYGRVLVMGSKRGTHFITSAPPIRAIDYLRAAADGKVMGAWGNTPIDLASGRPFSSSGEVSVVFDNGGITSPEEGFEFLTTTPGAQIQTDFEPTLNIALGNVGLDREPVSISLHQMRDFVESLLLTFESRFWP